MQLIKFSIGFLYFLFEQLQGLDASNLILLLTALIVAYYTLITRNLWKESKVQTELQLSPYLILYFARAETRLSVKNVGKGIATKIDLEGERIITTDIEKELEIKFNSIEILLPNEERYFHYKTFEDGLEIEADLGIYFFSRIPSENAMLQKRTFKLTYKNIFGQMYYNDVTLGADEYIIKKYGKNTLSIQYKHAILLKIQALIVRIEVWWKRKK
ncbi:MAG: hypothetical protein HZB82_06610 [Deltaproteobacteria bacterium]|nr:hypothetical protein [Deltaproteobacteria bacterium]